MSSPAPLSSADLAAYPGLAPLLAAPDGRPFVVAQLGQSLDGRIALPSGESRWINGPAALDHVHRLRAAVDAVVVGVGTAETDDPLLNVRRVAGRNPARVVIDPRGRLRLDRKCLSGADGARRLVIRSQPGPTPDGVEELVVPALDGRLAPVAIVQALVRVGLPRLLVEGGASTVSQFVAAGAVHRLHVLVAPVILGAGKTGLDFPGINQLSAAPRPATTVTALPGGDVLFDCDCAGRSFA